MLFILNAKPRDELVRIARETHPFRGDIRISCMTLQKETISTINSLIETLKDGQEGFRQAAEAVKDSQLKTLFNEYSLQRSRFAGELQNEAIGMGESDPENTSSTAGLPKTFLGNAAKIPPFRNTRRRWRATTSPRRFATRSRVSTPT